MARLNLLAGRPTMSANSVDSGDFRRVRRPDGAQADPVAVQSGQETPLAGRLAHRRRVADAVHRRRLPRQDGRGHARVRQERLGREPNGRQFARTAALRRRRRRQTRRPGRAAKVAQTGGGRRSRSLSVLPRRGAGVVSRHRQQSRRRPASTTPTHRAGGGSSSRSRSAAIWPRPRR